MNIKIWYSKSMTVWRWTLIDENLDQASGQNSDFQEVLNEISERVGELQSK